MNIAIGILLSIVAAIHLLPVSGMLSAEALTRLYGLNFSDPNLGILMRHRAVLFGLLGTFLLFAAFNPSYHALALIAGFVSVVSFLVLAYSTGGYNAALHRVVMADWVALVCLLVALPIYLKTRIHAP